MKFINRIYEILKLVILIFFAAAMIGTCIWVYQRIKYPEFFSSQNEVVNSSEEKMNDFAKTQEENYNNNNITKDTSQSLGYESLNNKEERYIYEIVKNNLDNITDSRDSKTGQWDLKTLTVKNCTINVRVLSWILFLILSDNPDVFWISDTVRLTNFSDGSAQISMFSIMSLKEKTQKQATLGKKVDEIINSIPKNYSDYSKELYLHDYLVTHCKYVLKGNDFPLTYTSYGCLIDGESVCQGYARAFQLLLSKANIVSQIIVGYRDKNEKHMWNAVKLGEDWYYVDVTWDQEDLFYRYTYFNITEEILKKDHEFSPVRELNVPLATGEPLNFNIPKCNSIKENYFEKNAVKFDNLNNYNKIKNDINSAIKNSKNNVIYIKFNKDFNFANAKNYILQNTRAFFNVYNKEKIQISYADILNQCVLAVKII